MYDFDFDEEDPDDDADRIDESKSDAKLPHLPQAASDIVVVVGYEHQYGNLVDDVLGDDLDEDADFQHEKEPNEPQPSAGQSASFMFFDFRHGKEKWPAGVELVNAEKGAELVDKAVADAEEEAKKLQEKEGKPDKDKQNKVQDDENEFSFDYCGAVGGDYWDYYAREVEDEGQTTETSESQVPKEAIFETLSDGSSAFVLQPGERLKFDLASLLNGGDESAAKRKKECKNKTRRGKSWGFQGGWGKTATFKQRINEYTLTMDLKVMDSLPREGLALFQTALVQIGGDQPGDRNQVKQTEGESVISSTGGVGILGSFGDISKAQVKLNRWHRVSVSVKCSSDPKQKGELLTWIDAASSGTMRSETIAANGRFALDPAALFLFSSGQGAMMGRTVAIRTVRVTSRATDDLLAKADLARDRILSMFNLEREREIDEQRRGLSLAAVFARPRPVLYPPPLLSLRRVLSINQASCA
jgi:hypothetical protein